MRIWHRLREKLFDGAWNWRGVTITAPTVTLIIYLLRLTGGMQWLEWTAYDQLFRWRFYEPKDQRIVIVAVSEKDLRYLQQWPTSDETLAETIQKIRSQKPAAIGLDIYRNFPVSPGTKKLTEVFKTTPNLVGITKLVNDITGAAIPPSPVLAELDQVGANDMPVDNDGKVRRGLLYLDNEQGETVMSFALKISLIYLKTNHDIEPEPAPENHNYLKLGHGVFRLLEPFDGGYVRGDTGGSQILVNWRGGARNFSMVLLSDVLENRIPPDFFRNRIVLIGPTATSLNDFFFTPFSNNFGDLQRTSGVEVQANLISQIISAAVDKRPLIRTLPEIIEILWMLSWGIVGALLTWRWRNNNTLVPESLWRSFFSASSIGLLLLISCYGAFLLGWWIPLIPPLLAFVSAIMLNTTYVAILEREDRQVVMNLFGRHVTREIAEIIWRDRNQFLQSGRLAARRLEATMLFADIQDFSTIAEELEPEVLMEWLNEYMDAVVGVIIENGGVIDKFIGDAVMAAFGVPLPSSDATEVAQDARQAIICALEMADVLEQLNQYWREKNRPTIRIRIGIATGTVVVGSLGNSARLEYTTIGDSVNIASRLESFDKTFEEKCPCRILINDRANGYLEGRVKTRWVGTVALKGRRSSSDIFQVLLA
ncbi:MAG: CHASE2 domain-containing protein [Pseudanabaenaceae cyanobacterium]|jgi:adenylate cyclase